MDVTLETTLRDVIAKSPATADVFLQHGRLYRARPGNLYATYDPPLTIAEYAALNGVDAEALLGQVRAAAETDEVAPGVKEGAPPPKQQAPPAGSIGYTASYREPSAEVTEVPFVWALEAQGPD